MDWRHGIIPRALQRGTRAKFSETIFIPVFHKDDKSSLKIAQGLVNALAGEDIIHTGPSQSERIDTLLLIILFC